MILKGRQNLSFKMARLTVALALLLGFVSGLTLVYLDFLGQEKLRQADVQQILTVARRSAEKAVNELDRDLAGEVVAGLMSYNYVVSATIVDERGEALGIASVKARSITRTRWLTQLLADEIMDASIGLDLPKHLQPSTGKGEMHILIDQDLYLQSFYGRAIFTLIGGVLGALILSLLLLGAYHIFLTRPLVSLARQLETIDPEELDANIVTVGQEHEKDELGLFAASINKLVGRIRILLSQMAAAHEELAESQTELQVRVEERTSELEYQVSERERAEEELRQINQELESRVEARTRELQLEADKHKATTHQLAKMKELADSANRAKTSFLANMSHELRTPLNAIIGFTTIMKDELFGPVENKKYQEYLGDIQMAGRHLSDVLGNILDLAKVESGEVTMNEESMNLRTLFNECLSMFAVQARASGIKLKIKLTKAFPKIRADQLRTRQIVINLVSNALKYSGDGSTIILGAGQEKGGAIVFWVKDNGRGIPADQLERVLMPFAQVGTDYVKPIEGVGLGLPLAKSLAELHGGRLWLESEVGQGTTVYVLYPAARNLSRKQGAKSEPAKQGRSRERI